MLVLNEIFHKALSRKYSLSCLQHYILVIVFFTIFYFSIFSVFNSSFFFVCQPPTGQRLCLRRLEKETESERETGTGIEKETGGKALLDCRYVIRLYCKNTTALRG